MPAEGSSLMASFNPQEEGGFHLVSFLPLLKYPDPSQNKKHTSEETVYLTFNSILQSLISGKSRQELRKKFEGRPACYSTDHNLLPKKSLRSQECDENHEEEVYCQAGRLTLSQGMVSPPWNWPSYIN